MYVGVLRDFPFVREGSHFWPWKKAWKLSKFVWNDGVLVVAIRHTSACSESFHLLAKARIFCGAKKHGNSRNLFGMMVVASRRLSACSENFHLLAKARIFWPWKKAWKLSGIMAFWGNSFDKNTFCWGNFVWVTLLTAINVVLAESFGCG